MSEPAQAPWQYETFDLMLASSEQANMTVEVVGSSGGDANATVRKPSIDIDDLSRQPAIDLGKLGDEIGQG